MTGGPPRAGVGQIVARVAPMYDIIKHGSTDVNAGRATQSGAVSSRARGRREAAAVRALTRDEVMALHRARPAEQRPPDVDLALFVELSDDLDPDARRTARSKVARAANRGRWKLNTGAIEVRGTRLSELEQIPGVAYIEPGQTLRAPNPTVGDATRAPDLALRRVSAQARRHQYGRDVLVGIIDVQGFDFAHPDFLDDSGRTRWEAIWDQGGTSREPPTHRDRRYADLDYGADIRKEHMDRAIAASGTRNMAAASLEPQSTMIVGSHGTHVASIAAGNRGVARHARIAGVLIALRREDMLASSSFYDSTRIAHAVDYLIALAAELGGEDGPLPLSINISLGTNGHAHDTSSAMARWIDNALTTPGRCVCVAAGNAGQVEPASPTDRRPLTGRIHAGGSIAASGLRQDLGWIVVGDQVADISENEMEIWYGPQDRMSVEVRPPGGSWVGPFAPGEHRRNMLLDNGTMLSVHNETYNPANGANRISIVLSPYFGPVRGGVREIGPIAAGEWLVRLTGTVIRDGRYDAWIERDDPQRVDGRSWRYPSFFAPGSYTDDRMISTLACAERILAVANVDVARNMAHVTSSRGPTREGRYKPDVGADGTEIVAARALGGEQPWVQMTGTSMASPYVCGVAALMLAIVPELTAAQIQGIVRSTSRPLAGHDFTWRNDTGFGVIDAAACVEEAVLFGQERTR